MDMPDWNLLRAFHATAEAGSLSAAARVLGLTQPTLSRQVAALEGALGVTLFERAGRRLNLTEAGHDLRDHAARMEAAAQGAALAATGRAQAIAGRVVISASDTYAAFILPQIVARIRAEAPQITVVILSDNALSDLHRREADIALRHVRPDRPGLTARLVRETAAHFYASKSWIARHGTPTRPADLPAEALLGMDDGARYAAYLRGIGFSVSGEGFRLLSESSVVVWELVRQGLGVAPMLQEIAARTPDVARIFPALAPISVPVWLVAHREVHTARRVRIVFDILAEELTRL